MFFAYNTTALTLAKIRNQSIMFGRKFFLIFLTVNMSFSNLSIKVASQDSPDTSTGNSKVTDLRTNVPEGFVVTSIGLIQQGFKKTIQIENVAKTIDIFLGIPYAEPPIKELRFRNPIPKKRLSKSLKAEKMPDGCMQSHPTVLNRNGNVTVGMSEDCLYLNAWRRSGSNTRSLPVMVWIYGGGFQFGFIDFHTGEYLAAVDDVIVFAMNYRVGVFGFLAADNSVIKGNYGLLDQQLALKWIKENAAAFGGDPERITIFGESAGAASVNLQMLNEESRKCFTRGIMQSGSALARWVVPLDFESNCRISGKFLRHRLKCVPQTHNNFTEILSCAQNLNAQFILEEQIKHKHFNFQPVVDGAFIDEHPLMEAVRGKYVAKEVMMGVNKDEGAQFMIDILKQFGFNELDIVNPKMKLNSTVFKEIINKLFIYWPQNQMKLTNIALKALQLHLTPYSNPENGDFNVKALSSHYGRDYFVCSQNDVANFYLKNNTKVYFYKFSHKPSYSRLPTWAGSAHGVELGFMLGYVYRVKGIKPEEKALSLNMMKRWTAFAKSGNPTLRGVSDDEWLAMSKDNKEYLEFRISSDKSISKLQKGGVDSQQCGFLSHQLTFLNDPNIVDLSSISPTTSTLSTAKVLTQHQLLHRLE